MALQYACTRDLLVAYSYSSTHVRRLQTNHLHILYDTLVALQGFLCVLQDVTVKFNNEGQTDVVLYYKQYLTISLPACKALRDPGG